jgi:hypothetical protein
VEAVVEAVVEAAEVADAGAKAASW